MAFHLTWLGRLRGHGGCGLRHGRERDLAPSRGSACPEGRVGWPIRILGAMNPSHCYR